MVLRRKTTQDIIRESLVSLQAAGVITNTNAGGAARTLLEVMAGQLGQMYNTVQVNSLASFVSTASGLFLDLMGEAFGVVRRVPSFATVEPEDEIIQFFVDTGTLKDQLPGKIIPQGTTIQTAEGDVTYIVTRDVTFADVDTFVYVGAQSQQPGTSINVGQGVLVVHDLGNPLIKVTNVAGIDDASDTESDDSMRFRISNAVYSGETANKGAVRAAALRSAGVSDVLLREFVNGTGTSELFLVPRRSRLSPTTLNEVSAAVDVTRALGTRVTVRQPTAVRLEVKIRLTFLENITPQQQQSTRGEVTNNIIDYIEEIPLGGILIINELRERVMSTSAEILDMSIECFIIGGRPKLLANYGLAVDEIFVLEQIDDPIRVE